MDEFLQRFLPPFSLHVHSLIQTGGGAFVCANICLAVCVCVRSAIERTENVPLFFFNLLQERSVSCDSIHRDFLLS